MPVSDRLESAEKSKASCLMRLLSNGQMAVTAPVREDHGDFQVAGMQMMGVPM